MRWILLLLLFFFASVRPLSAELRADKKNGALYVQSATTEEVQELFKKYKFDDYSQMFTKVPRIFLTRLPSDWAQIPESEEKNKTFIRIMLPLVLAENEKVLQERQEIEQLQKKYRTEKKLSDSDIAWLEKKAEKYDVFTRLKDEERTPVLFKMLLEKVDTMPPSIMVSTAAIYSNWGNSRIALQANSLYLEEVWYQDNGLKPLDDAEADYHYKIFNTLAENVASRLLKLNTHINYRYIRQSRLLAREMDRPLYGPQVAALMMQDSNLKNIAGLIDYTFSHYKITKTDYLPTLENVQ